MTLTRLVSTEDRPFYSSELRDVPELHGTAGDSDDAPSFDLSSSTLRDVRKIAIAYDDDSDSDDPANRQVVEFNSAAADFLSQREWQGLKPDIGQTPIARALPGRSGIASSYAEEASTS